MRAAALLLVACVAEVPDAGDFRDPGLGGLGVSAIEKCRQSRYEPCGWVYWFPAVETEFCIVWEDRIGPYPVGLRDAAESLFGDSELSSDPRFAGTPVCWYACPPPVKGCNCKSPGTCFCLEPAP